MGDGEHERRGRKVDRQRRVEGERRGELDPPGLHRAVDRHEHVGGAEGKRGHRTDAAVVVRRRRGPAEARIDRLGPDVDVLVRLDRRVPLHVYLRDRLLPGKPEGEGIVVAVCRADTLIDVGAGVHLYGVGHVGADRDPAARGDDLGPGADRGGRVGLAEADADREAELVKTAVLRRLLTALVESDPNVRLRRLLEPLQHRPDRPALGPGISGALDRHVA